MHIFYVSDEDVFLRLNGPPPPRHCPYAWCAALLIYLLTPGSDFDPLDYYLKATLPHSDTAWCSILILAHLDDPEYLQRAAELFSRTPQEDDDYDPQPQPTVYADINQPYSDAYTFTVLRHYHQ